MASASTLHGKFRVLVNDDYVTVHPETKLAQVLGFPEYMEKMIVQLTSEQFNAFGGTILEKNQIAVETDTGKIKFGDGETRYPDLPYVAGERNATYCRQMTHLEWEQCADILPKGILAVESDNLGIKVGDGEHTWEDLPYMLSPELYNRKMSAFAEL